MLGEGDEEWEELFPEFVAVVGQMHEAGMTLLAGTDIAADRPTGTTLHRELGLLVEAGLSPAEALRAATITPARVLGVDDELGTVRGRKLADLVLLDAEPARGHLEHAADLVRDRARARLRAGQPVSGLKLAFDAICQRVPFHV